MDSGKSKDASMLLRSPASIFTLLAESKDDSPFIWTGEESCSCSSAHIVNGKVMDSPRFVDTEMQQPVGTPRLSPRDALLAIAAVY